MSLLILKRADLTESELPHIAHGVNCQGYMGKGIALQIKEKHPEVFKQYKSFITRRFDLGFNDRRALLGQAHPVAVGHQIYWNLFTQYTTGYVHRFASYDAIDESVRAMMKKIENSLSPDAEKTFVGITKIGCSNGGANWRVVREILEYIQLDYARVQLIVYDRDM